MGFDFDLCTLPRNQKEELKCPLCLDILENPKILIPCGHTYCETCLDDLTLGRNACPGKYLNSHAGGLNITYAGGWSL